MAEGSVLVIEVADSSLEYDRQVKAPLYARYDVLEYWIVDLTTAAIEVYREAQDGVYRPASRFGVGKPVSPLFLPEARIEVGDLMRV
jgi:Uma2 family endonuclease